ncbi:SAM-dependent methyltransferase, partial [Streptomyces sp. SID14478]|nr:SAM-dependent methyltransferase [Streptomyces sp. SID14478]
LRAAGLGDVRGVELAWEHRADADEWWGGFADEGVGTVGTMLSALSPGGRAAARAHYDRLAVELAAPDGRLALPHIAVLADGTRP